jgi:streptogramin lyase
VSATIDVCEAPEGMAADDAGLWVVCEEGAVVRIDPGTNSAGRPIEVGLEPRFVTVAFGSAWVSNYVDSTISRIDVDTGEVVAEIEAEFGPQVMVEAEDGIWVSSVDTDTVQRIDPETNEPEPPITTEALPDGLLAQGDTLWVATDLGPILQRLDPAAGEITGTWVVSDQGAINANQLIAEAGGAFWFPLLDAGEVVKVEIPEG